MSDKVHNKSIQYFNLTEFDGIMKIFNEDKQLAKDKFEAYMNEYPEDYYAKSNYALLLIDLREFDKANDMLEKIIVGSKHSHHFNQTGERNIAFISLKQNLVHIKARLLAISKSYRELLDYMQNNPLYFDSLDVSQIQYFCENKLGILEQKSSIPSYRFNQCCNYSEEEFLNHTSKHVSGDDEPEGDGAFNENFPIKEVIQEIKKYIPSENHYCQGFFERIYYFKYENCGHSSGKITDYFKIVCIEDTDHFLTAYPIIGNESLPYVDLNYMQKKDNNAKRLSRIELFNKKYNIK